MGTTYNNVRAWLVARYSDGDRGASLIEYALLVGLIAVVCVVAVDLLGSNVSTSFSSSADSVSAN